MRWRRADLRGRVNGNLKLRFGRTGLTSYAGLEFVRRYFDTLGLVRLVRRELAGVLPRTDFGVPAMVLAILALLIAGGRRLRHLRYVDGDPLVLRLCGLRRLPTPRTVGRWLRVFRAEHLLPLQWLNALLVARAIRHAGVRRLTIDVDGSVVSTGQQVQWAQRGFNPHHRKVPSYYPITAYEAQSGQLLRVQNRPGNVHDGKGALRFLRDLFAQLAATLGAVALWAFMAGRGTHEKVYAELKGGFAFDCVPTMRYAANSAWQLLSVLAFNLVRGFQMATTAERTCSL